VYTGIMKKEVKETEKTKKTWRMGCSNVSGLDQRTGYFMVLTCKRLSKAFGRNLVVLCATDGGLFKQGPLYCIM